MLRKNSTMNSNFARPMNWLNRLQWISINTQSFLFRILEITKGGCIIMCLFETYLAGIVITFLQVVEFLTFYVPSHRWHQKYWCWNVGGSIECVKPWVIKTVQNIMQIQSHIFAVHIMYIPEKKKLKTRPRFLTPFPYFFFFWFYVQYRNCQQHRVEVSQENVAIVIIIWL